MPFDVQLISSPEFREQIERELTENILPFWMTYTVDKANGGFYGAVTNDLVVHNEVPRSSTLCARILWTYSTAYRRLGEEQYLSMARRAYDYLTQVFWDEDNSKIQPWLMELIGAAISPAALPFLLERLRDDHELVRYWAVRGLQQLDTKEARTALWRAGVATRAQD